MDFKISDTNKGKKSLIYDGFIYRIDGVLKSEIYHGGVQIRNLSTIVESRYLFYGFDNEIRL